MTPRVWLITGSSSGFGRSLAEAALERGDRVAATARRPESLDELVARDPERVLALPLDVTSSVRPAPRWTRRSSASARWTCA